MNDLKCCPFCGEDDLKIFQNAVRDMDNKPTSESYWFVSCRSDDCFFAGPQSFKSLDHAVEIWNRRNGNQDDAILTFKSEAKALQFIGSCRLVGYEESIKLFTKRED